MFGCFILNVVQWVTSGWMAARLAEAVSRRFGRIPILCGFSDDANRWLEEYAHKLWERVLWNSCDPSVTRIWSVLAAYEHEINDILADVVVESALQQATCITTVDAERREWIAQHFPNSLECDVQRRLEEYRR